MMPTGLLIASALGGTAVSLATLVKVILPAWRGMRAAGKRVSGALDNIGGRDPFVDPATGQLQPRIPAIGERFTGIEQKLDGLADTNNRLDTIDSRLAAHEERFNGIDTAIALAIGEKFDRGAENAFAAVEKTNADVIDVDPS